MRLDLGNEDVRGGGGGIASRAYERRLHQRTLEESDETEIYRHDEAEEEYYKGKHKVLYQMKTFYV